MFYKRAINKKGSVLSHWWWNDIGVDHQKAEEINQHYIHEFIPKQWGTEQISLQKQLLLNMRLSFLIVFKHIICNLISFVEWLLYASYQSKHFTYIISFNFHYLCFTDIKTRVKLPFKYFIEKNTNEKWGYEIVLGKNEIQSLGLIG